MGTIKSKEVGTPAHRHTHTQDDGGRRRHPLACHIIHSNATGITFFFDSNIPGTPIRECQRPKIGNLATKGTMFNRRERAISLVSIYRTIFQ